MESSSERGLLLANRGAIERAMWASKIVLLGMGAVSTATLFRVAVIPYILDLSLSTVPRVWVSFRAWVSPFYIYLALNFIIAAIAVSSCAFRPDRNDAVPKPSFASVVLEKSNSCEPFHMQETTAYEEEEESNSPEKDEGETELSDGGDVGPQEESSMDDTWKAIMESQRRRRLGRSETMVARPRRLETVEGEGEGEEGVWWAHKEMKKLATFTERVSLIRDKSMSPEELNLRADAFIKKVNDDMRLQRLESDQRFRDMVNGGL